MMRTAHAEYITKTHIHLIFICQVKIKLFPIIKCVPLIRGQPGKLKLPCTNPINIKQALGPNLYRPCEQKCRHSDS